MRGLRRRLLSFERSTAALATRVARIKRHEHINLICLEIDVQLLPGSGGIRTGEYLAGQLDNVVAGRRHNFLCVFPGRGNRFAVDGLESG